MKSYPEYKETEIKWVGKLPSHWKVTPLKYAALVNREALTEQVEEDFELQYIDIGNVNQLGLVNPPERMKFIDAPSRARRIIKKNDTIISTVRTYLKAVAFIDRDDDNLIASTGFATLTSLNETHPKYLYYLVSNQGFVDTVSACSTGVSYPAITSTELARITAWLPPLPEQQAIADFLDRKTAQIDALIEKKQQQIDLLQEQRTALINHAVTKGLNLDVRMKDSGVEWLGEIPSHWEVKRLKHLLQKDGLTRGPFGSSLKTEFFVPQGYKVYEQKNAIYDDNNLGGSFINGEKFAELKRFAVKEGDIIMSCSGTIGKISLIQKGFQIGVINQALLIMQLNERIIQPYFEHLFRGFGVQNRIIDNSQGSAMKNLVGMDIFKNISLPVPPIDEQQKIADYLDQLNKRVFQLLEMTRNQLELLQEYRTALISEAVTGKIDVRTAETVHE